MSRKKQISPWEVSLAHNWGLIKREVLVDSVVDSMIESKIVTTEEWRVVKNKHITESSKVEELLFLIQKRGSDAIKFLPNILENAGYYHITEALKRFAISADTNCRTEETELQTSKPEEDDGFIEEMHQTNHQIQSSVGSSTVQEEISKLRVEIGEITGLTRDLETDKIRVNEKLLVMEQKNEDLETEIKKLQSKDKELSESMNDLRKQVEDLTIKLNESEKEHQKLNQKNTELRAQVESLTTELKERKQENHQLETENNELKEDLIKRDRVNSESMQTFKKEKEELEKKLQEKTNDYVHLQNLQKEMKEKENDRFNNVQLLRKEAVELKDKMEKALIKVNEAEERLQAQDNKIKEDEMRHSDEVSLLKKEIKKQRECIDGLQIEKHSLADKVRLLEIENERLKVDNKQLEENLRSLQNPKPIPEFNSVTKTQGKEPNHRRLPQGSRGGRGGPKGK